MTYDPFNAAMEAQPLNSYTRIFGQFIVDVWPCALVKGQGKVPFDAGTMKENNRRTALDLTLDPVGMMDNLTKLFERHIVAESRAWTNVTLPSIKALNVNLRDLNRAWVAVEMKPTGRKWESNEGEKVDETCFEIVAVFPDENKCREAYQVFYAKDTAEDAPAPAANNNAEKSTAAQFLMPLWMQAKRDVAEYSKLLANNPLTSRFFTVSSPEVLAVIQAGQ